MIEFNTFRTLWEKMSRAKKLDIYNKYWLVVPTFPVDGSKKVST